MTTSLRSCGKSEASHVGNSQGAYFRMLYYEPHTVETFLRAIKEASRS